MTDLMQTIRAAFAGQSWPVILGDLIGALAMFGLAIVVMLGAVVFG